jgi:AmmeMemoRadiSam system protein A
VTQFDLGIAVLTLARSAIAETLGLSALETMTHASLEERSATFVTLMQAGKLRGCVGSLHRRRTLRDDVRANAVAAAFRDPRFAPLDASELAHTSVEVSLLSSEERIVAASEEELMTRLRPGVDGVIVEFGSHRATLLPQVWEQLQDPRNFLAALKLKAGLPEDFWSSGMLVSRYEVTTWKEQEPAPATEDAVPYLLAPTSASSS